MDQLRPFSEENHNNGYGRWYRFSQTNKHEVQFQHSLKGYNWRIVTLPDKAVIEAYGPNSPANLLYNRCCFLENRRPRRLPSGHDSRNKEVVSPVTPYAGKSHNFWEMGHAAQKAQRYKANPTPVRLAKPKAKSKVGNLARAKKKVVSSPLPRATERKAKFVKRMPASHGKDQAQHDAIINLYLQGSSYLDIAQQLGVTRGIVAGVVHRAKGRGEI